MQHQHGPQCNHSRGHGPAHGPAHGQGGHSHGNPFGGAQLSYSQYRQTLKKMWQSEREFYWAQVLTGTSLDKFLIDKKLATLRIFSCLPILMLLGWLENYLSLECLPNEVRGLTSGMFIPLIGLFLMNYNSFMAKEVQVDGKLQQDPYSHFKWLMYVVLGLYLLVVIRGSGSHSNRQNRQKSKQGIKQRPYLENHQMNCQQCGILKVFRANHCRLCKHCVPKFTRHSAFFNTCIGAANELPAMLFFLSLIVFNLVSIANYFQDGAGGYITGFMVLFINWFVAWNSFVELATFFLLNIWYGITENELKSWMFQQYLVKFPLRQFQNNVNMGFKHNLVESIYSFLGISGIEKDVLIKRDMIQESQNPQPRLQFRKLDSGKNYTINWAQAFFYLLPMLPNHPSRDMAIQMMRQQEPRMIQNYRLSQKMKAQVMQENKQPMNQMQIGQKVMMKMQAHMMKNPPQAFQPPSMGLRGADPNTPQSSQQQKMIQMQILEHLAKDIASFPEAKTVNRLIIQLKENKITPQQANVQLRTLQQEIMRRKMQEMMKQQKAQKEGQPPAQMQIQENRTPNADKVNPGEDEEEHLKKEEEIEDDS